MLKKKENVTTTVTTNISAESVVEKDDGQVVVLSMSATISKINDKVSGYVQNSKNIFDVDLYNENEETCKADIKEFDDYVNGLLKPAE